MAQCFHLDHPGFLSTLLSNGGQRNLRQWEPCSPLGVTVCLPSLYQACPQCIHHNLKQSQVIITTEQDAARAIPSWYIHWSCVKCSANDIVAGLNEAKEQGFHLTSTLEIHLTMERKMYSSTHLTSCYMVLSSKVLKENNSQVTCTSCLNCPKHPSLLCNTNLNFFAKQWLTLTRMRIFWAQWNISVY